MKAEVMNITLQNGKLIKLLDNELGTILMVNHRVMLNTYAGGDSILKGLPWETPFGKKVLEYVQNTLEFANISLDLATNVLKFEVRDGHGNDVGGIVDTKRIKLADMCREISDGKISIEYIANARITAPDKFEEIAYALADIFDKFGK